MIRAPKRDIAQEITDLIIAKIEAGVMPWRRPWQCAGGGGRPLRAQGKPYTGINSLFLWAIADACGYRSRFWMTRRQAQELGGEVRSGERCSPSIYFNSMQKTETNAVTGDTSSRFIRFMRAYSVYNCDQIDGLPPHYYPDPIPADHAAPSKRQPAIDAFFKPIPIDVRHGGDRAFYAPGRDFVQMPPKSSFISADHYAATLGHELGHATGASHRLARTFGKRFGDKTYAFEELVADITSGLICSELALPPELHDNHASYIANWLEILRGDKSAIITAAAKAERAFDWLSAWSAPQTQIAKEEAYVEPLHAYA